MRPPGCRTPPRAPCSCRRQSPVRLTRLARGAVAVTAATIPSAPPLWRCPVCGLPLLPSGDGKAIACASRHSFDVAREGYVNLATRLKRGTAPPAGGPAFAYAARQRVFGAGVFDDVMAAAADAVVAVAGGGAVLDAGCGEGSYAAAVAARGLPVRGVDVSKDAVRAAARSWKQAPYPAFAVGSSFDVPLPDACLAAALVAFAPFPGAELERLLAPCAAAVVVRAGPDHLDGLKALIYGAAAAPRARPPPPGATRVTADLQLEPDVASALLAMTPYQHRDARGGAHAAAVVAADGLRTRLDVVVETVGRAGVAGWGVE